jgi:uncharacterized protein (DUF3820 family)
MSMTMPFGKHRGTSLDNLDLSYIEWLLDQEFVNGALKRALELQVEDRSRPQLVQTGAPKPPAALESYLRQIILTGYKKCREDLKDNPEKLKSLQSAREQLEEFAGL